MTPASAHLNPEGGEASNGPEPRADLHIHSHFSDGTESPAEIMRRAARPLALISICDHDTVEAYDHLPSDPPVALLPGIEISAHLRGEGLHILGYFPGGFSDSFRAFVTGLEDDRRRRIHDGVRRLREQGIPLRWSQLEEAVGEGVPCRSHVARALVSLGVGRSPVGLYGRYLTNERFGLPRASAAETIARIRSEGGMAVWAHPPRDQLATLGPALIASGLDGVETPVPAPRHRSALRRFARDHGLAVTGGSDHHGGPRARLGQRSVPLAEVPEALRRPSPFAG